MSNKTTERKQQDISLDEILSSIRSVVMDEPVKKTHEKIPLISPKVQDDISVLPTVDKAEPHSQKKKTENLPTKPFLLTNVVKMGAVPSFKPIVSEMTEYQVEESLHELVDILSSMKDELPDEFYEKQDMIVKTWLNQYLPEIVEHQVQKEIRRIGNQILQNK